MRIEVGQIEIYPVYYIPEKDIIFCKNTAIAFPLMERAIKGNLQRYEFPEKNLTVKKDFDVVTLGCLTTTMANCLKIRHSVNIYKRKNK